MSAGTRASPGATAAKKLFDLRAGETLDASSRFPGPDAATHVRQLFYSEQVVKPGTINIGSAAKDGESLEMQLTVASFADEIDDTSRLILVADQVVKACI